MYCARRVQEHRTISEQCAWGILYFVHTRDRDDTHNITLSTVLGPSSPDPSAILVRIDAYGVFSGPTEGVGVVYSGIFEAGV